MRRKHRKDKNHGKNGWVGGNPRYRGKGFQKGDRAKVKARGRKEMDTTSESVGQDKKGQNDGLDDCGSD